MNLQTVRTACKETGIPEYRVRQAIHSGRLEVMQLGNRQLVDRDMFPSLFQVPPDDAVGCEEVCKATGLTMRAGKRGVKEGWRPCMLDGNRYAFELDKVMDAIRARMTTATGGNEDVT